jgi:hypothetical protein
MQEQHPFASSRPDFKLGAERAMVHFFVRADCLHRYNGQVCVQLVLTEVSLKAG